MKFIQVFVLIICSYSYFAFSELCIRMDGKINGYDKEHYFFKVDEKKTMRILRKRLAKNLDRFLNMNKNNKVQECFPVDSIEKSSQKRKKPVAN